AGGLGRVADTLASSGSKGIAFLPVARAQIIFRRHHGWPLRRPMRVEAFIDHGLDAAVRAHLDDVDSFGVGAPEHPMLLAKLGEHAVNRTLGAERLATGDTEERLLFLENAQRRIPCPKIQPRLERDDL